jgi:hypothetical protein
MASWAPEQIPFVTVIGSKSKFKSEERIKQVISYCSSQL